MFNKSTCLKEKITFSDLDCKKHLFSRIFTAPNMAGSYNITMEETLDYRCKNNRKSNSGRKVGTVTIEGEFVSSPKKKTKQHETKQEKTTTTRQKEALLISRSLE